MWQTIAAVVATYAALMGGLYAVVTKPISDRLNNLVARMTAMEARMTSMEAQLVKVEEPLTRLEERTPPLVHR